MESCDMLLVNYICPGTAVIHYRIPKYIKLNPFYSTLALISPLFF